MELTARNICKRFGGQVALDEVSLTARPGVLALLGPNGSGKTSLLRVLATVLRPDSGSVMFDGRCYTGDLRPVRQVLGYVPQYLDLPGHLTPRGLLRYMAQLKGVPAEPQAGQLLRDLGLGAEADKRLTALSSGQVRRAAIAQALLGSPRLLILDEPIAGLDPEERDRVLRLIAAPGGGRVVIMSTHLPAEAESVASQVLVLNEGRALFAGAAAELRRQAGGCVYDVTVPSEQVEFCLTRYTVSRVTPAGDYAILRIVGEAPAGLAGSVAEGSLEDAYLWLQRRQNQTAGQGVQLP